MVKVSMPSSPLIVVVRPEPVGVMLIVITSSPCSALSIVVSPVLLMVIVSAPSPALNVIAPPVRSDRDHIVAAAGVEGHRAASVVDRDRVLIVATNDRAESAGGVHGDRVGARTGIKGEQREVDWMVTVSIPLPPSTVLTVAALVLVISKMFVPLPRYIYSSSIA